MHLNPLEQHPQWLALQAENQQLIAQVQQLVRVERSMIEFQDQLDLQIRRYRQLNAIAQRLRQTFDQSEILAIALEFMLYDLNFERGAIFERHSSGEFQLIQADGYDDLTPTIVPFELSTATIAALAQSDLLTSAMIPADGLALAATAEIDQWVLMPICPRGQVLEYLILLGNTTDRAKHFTPIANIADYGVVLSNLTAQVTAAIGQAQLYHATRDQATTLQTTLNQLKSTQTQLIQTEKMSSLGQLVAGVAHEINNPVGFIAGNLLHTQTYAQDLLRLLTAYEQAYPEGTALIQEIREEIDIEFLYEDFPKALSSMTIGTERIKEIVLSLRNFSRLDESEFKAVDLHEGIDSTLLILHHRLKASPDRPTIQVTPEYGPLPLIECAPGLVNQVMMNLLSNAIDALESAVQAKIITAPEIKIVTELDASGEGIYIRVIDNGTGIPSEILSRLFDPFFTTKPVGKGTGLGLSISYQIITEEHGGKLECRSVPGQGTTFQIWLPCKNARSHQS
jgi:signal transduction histidine kinase